MDSDEELWYTIADELGLNVISMPYVMNDEVIDYWLGKDFDDKDFFNKIRKGSMPTTCALNPDQYVSYFEPFFKNGKDILYVHFSNKLSGTLKYMEIALQDLYKKYPERKLVTIDTKNISVGAGMMVEDLAKMFNDGICVEEIVKFADEHRNNYSEMFTVNDLNHLKRGGRLSAVQAFIGGMLDIKPIIRITEEGELKKIMQVSGRKKAISSMLNLYQENAVIDDKHPVYVLHADCEKEALSFKEQLLFLHPNLRIVIQAIGPTVGAHCGPDTLGIAYYATHR